MNVGDLVKMTVNWVTVDRTTTSVGKVVSIHGAIAKVRFRRAWGNGRMVEAPFMVADLKPFKPRNPENYSYL